jgi:arylsulfatase A-like enzyme
LGFYTNSSCPWNRGFHTDFGYLGGMEDYWTHARKQGDFEGFDLRKQGVVDRAAATTAGGDTSKYSTKLFRSRAVELIEDHAANHSASPFFLYMPFQAVHAPLQAPKFWLDKFNQSDFNSSSAGANSNRWTYAAMVRQMDFAVGKVRVLHFCDDESNLVGLWADSLMPLRSPPSVLRPPFTPLLQVVDALKANGMYNNSLIILSADNGGTEKGGGYNW